MHLYVYIYIYIYIIYFIFLFFLYFVFSCICCICCEDKLIKLTSNYKNTRKRSERTHDICVCFNKVKILVITVLCICFLGNWSSFVSVPVFVLQCSVFISNANRTSVGLCFAVLLQMPGSVWNLLLANSLFQEAKWSVNWFHESVFEYVCCTGLVICVRRQQSSARQWNLNKCNSATTPKKRVQK